MRVVAGASLTDRRSFYETSAASRELASKRFYHRLLERYYRFLVPPGLRVLEIGCGFGHLLAALKPSRGVGIDFSDAISERARALHPELEIYNAAAPDFEHAQAWRNE